MERLISKLPPLKALVAFEAVVRLGTITAAAKELTSTQPAISQHIKILENNLGASLFYKQGRLLKPTSDALKYYKQIQISLNNIANNSEHLRKIQVDDNRVDIIANTGLATLWLLPLLPKLKAEFPNIHINITFSDIYHASEMQYRNALFIGFGKLNTHAKQMTLFTEKVAAVCSPDYAKTHKLSDNSSVKDIIDHHHIQMDEHDDRWLNWRDWLAHAGHEKYSYEDTIFLGNYHSVISDTQASKGIALGWINIIDDLIKNGSLVLACKHVVHRVDYGYFIDKRYANNDACHEICNKIIDISSYP